MKESAGNDFVTTLPAAMTQRFPMVTPGQIVTFPPIQQSSPMQIGNAVSIFSLRSI